MSAEVETTLKRIQSHRGVQGIVIADHLGRVLKTTMTEENANKYGSLLSILGTKQYFLFFIFHFSFPFCIYIYIYIYSCESKKCCTPN